MSQSLTALYLQNPQLAQAISRRARGQQMLQQGGDSSPIDSPWQGVARLAQALVGGYEQGQADKSIKAAGDEQKALMAQLSAPMPGMQPAGQWSDTTQSPGAAAPAQPAQGAMPAWGSPELIGMVTEAAQKHGIPLRTAMAMVRQESGGNPAAVGDGGQSLGLGQIQDRTARDPGYGVAPMDPALRTDPRANLDFMMRYYKGKGAAMGATDLTNPAHEEIALRAYNGGGDPNYVQNVRRWMQPEGAPQGDETIPAQMPARGVPPAPRTPDAVQHWTAQASELERRAMIAAQAGQPGIAGILQQQAQGARQMALARAPQPKTPIQVVDPTDPTGRRLIWADPDKAVGMAAPPKEPLVNIDQKGESAFSTERGKTFAARATGWEEAETKGNERLRTVQSFRKALEGIETGFGSETQITLGQIAKKLNIPAATVDAMGLDVNSTAKREEIRSLANKMVVGMLGAGGFPASGFSNADRDFLTTIMPGLGNSSEGNRAIMALAEEGAKRDIAVSRAWREWRKQNGESPDSVRRFEDEKMPGLSAPDGTVQRILEDSGWKDTTPTGAGAIPTITDPAEAQRLPSGTQFRTPDGRTLRVPAR